MASNKNANKTTVANNAAETANKEVIAPAAKVETKADKARVILGESYADMTKVPQRKDIIARLVKEAELTPAGAATYLQNYKGKNGLTQKALAEKATAVAA